MGQYLARTLAARIISRTGALFTEAVAPEAARPCRSAPGRPTTATSGHSFLSFHRLFQVPPRLERVPQRLSLQVLISGWAPASGPLLRYHVNMVSSAIFLGLVGARSAFCSSQRDLQMLTLDQPLRSFLT